VCGGCERTWAFWLSGQPDTVLSVSAPSWYAAREFARARLGTDVDFCLSKRPPDVVLEWRGSAYGRNDLRLVKVSPEGTP
jgi:hypothetical protein